MKTVRMPIYSLLLAAALTPGQVQADGEPCTVRRAPDVQERAFYANLAVLRAAVPPAPAGWTLRDNELLDPRHEDIPRDVCASYFQVPSLEIDAYYERAVDLAAEEDTLRRAKVVAPDPAALTAQIEQINAEITKLAEQAMAAGGRGDYAEVDRLNAGINGLSERARKMMDDAYSPQDAIIAERNGDRTASLRIAVNQTRENCRGQPQPIDMPGAVAYRCAYEDGYTPSGEMLDHAAARILVVLGEATVTTREWPRLLKEQREFTDQVIDLEIAYDSERPLAVHNVLIRIDSDNAERVDGLFRELKLEALKGLVGR